jgi:hypothetical protein
MTKKVMKVTVVWAASAGGDGATQFEKAAFEPHGLVVFDGVNGDDGRIVVYPWWTISRAYIGVERGEPIV